MPPSPGDARHPRATHIRTRPWVTNHLGRLITGPLAFFLSGLLDVLIGLRLAGLYLYRTRVRTISRR